MKTELADIIQKRFNVPEDDFMEAQSLQDIQGGSILDILVSKDVLTENQALEGLSIFYGIPFYTELQTENMSTDFTGRIPIQFLKEHLMVPLTAKKDDENGEDQNGESIADENDTLCLIAVNDPTLFQPFDDLLRYLKDNYGVKKFQTVIAPKETIISVINYAYDQGSDSAEQLVQDMEEDSSSIISEIEETADLLDDRSDAPLIKLVNHIISQSIKARASDIHIEPYQHTLKVRYRVDGILYELLTPPKHIQSALISRVKVMAKMNIAEKRLPQDGRIEVKKGDQDIDIRVSTIPTSFGERVVLRLLNKTSALLSLSDLGLETDKLEVVQELIKSPHGIILVTGPTGSGKTTTLYAVLSSINTSDINIITIEDPIEYQIPGISQIQVNQKIDLTFARGLRSIVRQDPDVILIGEIRDLETSEIAVQSALTGHLVFSTLHTNDSAGSITRLVDIGVEPFLISSSVIAVMAQRLVRVLCTDCRESYEPDESILNSIEVTAEQIQESVIYRAKGCENCFFTGYRGRKSISEILVMDSNIRKLVLETFDAGQIKQAALDQNMITLREDGIIKVKKGITSISEVLRVAQK